MKSPRDTISLEGDCQCFILFAHEMTVLLAKNNVSCQPSILLVFSAGALISPTVCAQTSLEGVGSVHTASQIRNEECAQMHGLLCTQSNYRNGFICTQEKANVFTFI
jgi:hypothetical protein